jgi:membrane-bound lytic murein transglycosylase A
MAALLVAGLAGCSHAPRKAAVEAGAASTAPVAFAPPALDAEALAVLLGRQPTAPARSTEKSRWVPVAWSELPGVTEDALYEAWNAWIRACERPHPQLAERCPQVRALSIADPATQLQWLLSQWQPYRVEPLNAPASDGLLTAYFEPQFEARRLPGAGFEVPLYRLPAGVDGRKSWYSRQDIDTLPTAQAALQGRALLYLADPVDAMLLQIQGSGRLRVTEADGSQRLVRLAFAGHNGQPYQSVGRWLLERGELRDASWPGIRAWMVQNPERVRELLWRNPRVVFFKEEPLSDFDAGFGPRGAQGVALTPGRSVAVDVQSIPLGVPLWLASDGANLRLRKLVLAQDTGSAIVGAVRADYFAGWGDAAGELAGRLKQPLKLWVLWPIDP